MDEGEREALITQVLELQSTLERILSACSSPCAATEARTHCRADAAGGDGQGREQQAAVREPGMPPRADSYYSSIPRAWTQVLTLYVENLMAASAVFKSTADK